MPSPPPQIGRRRRARFPLNDLPSRITITKRPPELLGSRRRRLGGGGRFVLEWLAHQHRHWKQKIPEAGSSSFPPWAVDLTGERPELWIKVDPPSALGAVYGPHHNGVYGNPAPGDSASPLKKRAQSTSGGVTNAATSSCSWFPRYLPVERFLALLLSTFNDTSVLFYSCPTCRFETSWQAFSLCSSVLPSAGPIPRMDRAILPPPVPLSRT